MLGSVIGNQYYVEGVAGDTRSTRVYRAREIDTERTVALRMLLGEYASVPKWCLRFAREARLGALFQHPNVLAVLNAGYTTTGLPYIVTDFIDARTLEAMIRFEAPFSAERAYQLIVAICAGLEHIHERGVIHRNLTAGNVLIASNGAGSGASSNEREIPRITGFRLAVRAQTDPPGDSTDRPDKLLGAAPYMAPELVAQQPADQRTDLFSLGVVLYRMLSGVYPFEGSPLAVAINNRWDRPPMISERVPGLRANPMLESVALQLMAKDPADRYGRAEEALASLDAMWEEV
jgi:serine/threonine-protein kinase